MRSMSRMGMGFLLAVGIWVCGCLLSASAATLEEEQLLVAYQSGDLIRLHILAEDDSMEAQALKLSVRDAILVAFPHAFQGESAEEVYAQLEKKAEAMRLVAESTARQEGFMGAVTAEVGVLPLPAKAYGSVLLPTGNYRALRITLGRGEGQNWWCVLYPSLCLAVADEEPWRAPAKGESLAETSPQEEPPVLVWDTGAILKQWLAFPI